MIKETKTNGNANINNERGGNNMKTNEKFNAFQGEIDFGTFYGGRQGDLDGGTWHGGRLSSLDICNLPYTCNRDFSSVDNCKASALDQSNVA
jgi:hypothetical protein